MTDRSTAEENLRVIRSMMENATIYRAISAPGALIAGVLSIATAGAGVWLLRPAEAGDGWPEFALPWLAVFVVTTIVNFSLLGRDARRRGEAFFSPRMRLAIRGMLPGLLGGAACLWLQCEGGWATIASLWVLFYGISLLAASHFSPKSICWLGRAFFSAGFFLTVAAPLLLDSWRGADQTAVAHLLMGGTFGLFHVVYAACTWPRSRTDADELP